MFKIDIPTARHILLTEALSGANALRSLELTDPGDGQRKLLRHNFFIHIDLSHSQKDWITGKILSLLYALKKTDPEVCILDNAHALLEQIAYAIRAQSICVPIKIPLGSEKNPNSVVVILYDSQKTPDLLFGSYAPEEVCLYQPTPTPFVPEEPKPSSLSAASTPVQAPILNMTKRDREKIYDHQVIFVIVGLVGFFGILLTLTLYQWKKAEARAW